MTLIKGTPPATSNAGAVRSAPLPWKCPMGTVKVIYIGRKTYKTAKGEVEKSLLHYVAPDEKHYAFASARPDFVSTMAELQTLLVEEGKKAITASFAWPKGGTMSVNIA